MRFNMEQSDGPLGTYSLGVSLGCYMAFLYYSLMELTEEHAIAATVFAVIGGLFLIAGVILLATNSNRNKDINFQREALISDTVVSLSIIVTFILIAVLVILSQVIET